MFGLYDLLTARVFSGPGGGGDDSVLDKLLDRTITEIRNDRITMLGLDAFHYCNKLETVDFPAVTKIENNAFQNCYALKTVHFPAVEEINGSAFYNCYALETVDLPTTLWYIAGNLVFYNCSALAALILRKQNAPISLNHTNSFTGTPIASGTGYIYVPKALLCDDDAKKDYRRATNWSVFAAQFRALEDYTVDGTTTGALDPTKI